MSVTIVLISAIIPLLVILDWILKPKYNIPTPCRIPILGNMVFLGAQPHLKLTEWARRYGRLFSLHMFGHQIVVLNGYEAIQEALVVKGNETAGRCWFFRAAYVMNYHDDLIFHDISPKWRTVRKYVGSYIKKHSDGEVQQYEKMMSDLCSMLVDNIKADVTTSGCDDLDPYEHLYLFIVNGSSSLISGRTYSSTDDPTFQTWIQMERLSIKYAGMKDGQELDIMPWLRYFNTKSFQGLKCAVDTKASIIRTLKEEFEKKGKDGEEMEGLFSAMMSERERENGDLQELFDDKLIANIIYDLMIAGTATSTSSLYTFIIVMADYPDVQSKILEEIYAQINTKADGSKTITLSDRDQMPYTRAALLELQRFGSFVPLNLLHKTMKEITIQGVRLPKNTTLITNLWDVHHDEEFWEEPFKFRPERFIDEETGDLVLSSHPNMKRLLAFSAGPRVCLGQQLAMSRLFIVFTHLLRNFKIEKPSHSEVQSDSRSFDIGLALTPKRQELRFTNRV